MNAAGRTQHQGTLPGQPDFKFVPGNGSSSRYCKRMTDDEIERAKKIVLRLHRAGENRVAMMEQVSREVLHGRTISTAMVDKLRDDLGLIQHQSGRAARGQEFMSRTKQYSALYLTQGDDWADNVLCSSTQVLEGGIAIALQTSHAETPSCEPLQDTRGKRSLENRMQTPERDAIVESAQGAINRNLISLPTELISTTNVEALIAPDVRSVSHSSSTINTSENDSVFSIMETPQADLVASSTIECRTDSSPLGDDSPMLDYQGQSQSSVNLMDGDMTSILPYQKSTDVHGSAERRVSTTHKMVHPLDKTGLWTHYYHVLKKLKHYSKDIIVDGRTLQRSEGLWHWFNACDITTLNHVAYILDALRDFRQAFDVYFIIYCRLLKTRKDEQAPNPHFVLSAIGCARSARTPLQLDLARTLVERVREDLSLYHDPWLLEHTRTWNFLERYHKNSFDTKNESWEDVEEAAYWVATATIMSQPRLAVYIELAHDMPDYFLPFFSQNSFVGHIRGCDVAKASMLAGISKVSGFIRARKNDLNPLLKGWLRTDEDAVAEHGQVVSNMVLTEYLPSLRSARESTRPATTPNHAGFPCCWNDFPMLTIPFLLFRWTHRPDFKTKHASFLQRARKIKASEFLILAADEIHGHLLSGQGKNAVFDVYLSLMTAPKHLNHAPLQSFLPPALFLTVAKTLNLNYDTSNLSLRDTISDYTVGCEPPDQPQSVWPTGPFLTVAKTLDLNYDKINARKNSGADSTLRREQPQEDTVRGASFMSQDFADAASLSATVSISDESSISSGYRSFRAYSKKLRNSMSLTVRTRLSDSSGARTTRSSWSFSRNTGFPRDSSIRESQISLSSDVPMSG
ncbi:hypothetical protein EDD37DRAFT_653567 [Exophiala viscosa]|uniref:uncharacterized protein n=1 Tax=Exophiala viscosa TaxID=2486360 RepID=UPI002193E88E|nr:hypothetical protein EDD37DRAFT_653567 [Exophiala viscosa]